MDFVDVFGYFGALLIGVILGLIGGGGSILTVPVFVYVLGIDPVLATAYSLFVVGLSSLVGTIRNTQKGNIDFKTGFIFAAPALVTVYLTRKFIVPAIPEEIFTINNYTFTKDTAIMVFFALIMLIAAYFMIKNKKVDGELEQEITYNYPMIIIEGVIVGLLTGIVGAGGGFLIIPALVLLAKLPMKKAVGTSLLIIAIKSLFGFIGDIQNIELDWLFLLSFTAVSIVGIFIGLFLSKFIDGVSLKRGFGWFVIVMGIYIFLKELVF